MLFNKTFVIIFILVLMYLLSSCTKKHRPYFFISETYEIDSHLLLEEIVVKLDVINDGRKFHDEYLQKTSNPKVTNSQGKKFCMNVEGAYKNNYWEMMTIYSSKYLINFLGVGNVTTESDEYNYRLTFSISDFYIRQSFSDRRVAIENNNILRNTATTVAARTVGGVTGGIFGFNFFGDHEVYESDGEVSIIIDEIKLFNAHGNLVDTIESHELYLDDERLAVDDKCLCAFYNMDYYYKLMLSDLADKIKDVMIEDLK